MYKYFVATLVTSLCSVISLKLFTYFLPIEEYGTFAFLQSFFIVISSFFSKFISQALFKNYSKEIRSGSLSSLYWLIAIYTCIFSLLIVAIYSLINFFYDFEHLDKYYLVVIGITFATLFVDILNAFYQSSFRSNSFLYSEILRSILKLVMPILFYLYFDKNFAYFLIGYFVALLVTTLPQYYKILTYAFYSKKVDVEDLKSKGLGILLYSAPISVWYLCTQAINYIDRIILINTYDISVIAKYAANFSVFTFASQLLAIPLINSVHPKLLAYDVTISSSKVEFENDLNRYTKWYTYSQFLIIAGLAFFYKEVTLIVLNKQYILDYDQISILIIGYSFWTLGSFGNKQFEVLNSTYLMLISLGAAFILYFPLLYGLNYFIGAKSIFISKAVMYVSYPFLQILIYKLFSKTQIKINWIANFKQIFIVSSIWFVSGRLILFVSQTFALGILLEILLKLILLFIISWMSVRFIYDQAFVLSFVSQNKVLNRFYNKRKK